MISKINNPTILSIDKSSSKYPEFPNRKNTLKRPSVKIQKTSSSNGSGGVWSNKHTFDLRKDYNNLAQLYVKFELTTEAVSLSFTVEPYIATRLASLVTLLCRGSRTILSQSFPEYEAMRIEEILGTPLYTRIQQCIDPPSSFSEESVTDTVRTCTLYLPLSCFFSENPACFLKTRYLEDLMLEVTTATDYASIGLGIELTSLKVSLEALFHDDNDSSLALELDLMKKPGITKSLYGSYGNYRETDVTCTAGTSTQRVKLTCNYPAFALHVTMFNSTYQKNGITAIRLYTQNEKFVDLDSRINFQRYSKINKSFDEAEVFSYWFSVEKERISDSGLFICSKSDQLDPVYLEFDYEIQADDRTAVIFWETRTKYSVDDYGVILGDYIASSVV